MANELDDLMQEVSQASGEQKGIDLETPEYLTQEGTQELTKSYVTGIARALGLPGSGANLLRDITGYKQKSALPTGREIQSYLAKQVGSTHAPGEEPQDLMNRFAQEAGVTALPLLGMSRKGITAGRAAAETGAVGGAAVGGKALEATEWGQQNPELARATGEVLGGGIAGAPQVAGKAARKIPGGTIRILGAPLRGEWAHQRAARAIRRHTEAPEEAIARLQRARSDPEQQMLTATQRTRDPGLSGLRKLVDKTDPGAEQLSRGQESKALQALRRNLAGVEGSPGAGDVERAIDEIVTQRAAEAEDFLRRAAKFDKPEPYNQAARQKLVKAYDQAKEIENRVWSSLPDGERVVPSSTIQAYKDELENITRGGDPGEISGFLQKKLGKPGKSGKLTGGKLINAKRQEATAKELHQLYSRLGREIQELSDRGGQSNKVRILNRIRENLLDDIEESAGGEYEEAIRVSRDLNEKFSRGKIGEVLGFQRGTASPEATTLDELIGSGGEQARENIQQLLRSTPEAEEDVRNLLKVRFADIAADPKTKKIKPKQAHQFFKRNRRVLDMFPDLKKEMGQAASKQRKVDTLIGSRFADEISPESKRHAAASFFMKHEDPSEAANKVLSSGFKSGQLTNYLTDLKRLVSKDETGYAQEGLKNTIVEQMLRNSRRQAEDPITEQPFVSGRRFLQELRKVKRPLKQSELFTNEELDRIERMGKSLRKIEVGQKSEQASQFVGDAPDVLSKLAAQVTGATIGGRVARGTPGGSIQAAGKMSNFATWLTERLSQDEAAVLMTQATRDDKLLETLLREGGKIPDNAGKRILRLLAKETGNAAKWTGRQTPVGAVAPPAATEAERQGKQSKTEILEESLKSL